MGEGVLLALASSMSLFACATDGRGPDGGGDATGEGEGLPIGERCRPAAVDPCVAGAFCGSRGRCQRIRELDGGPEEADLCGAIDRDLEPLIPTVVFLLDRSGSMRMPFRSEEASRWESLDAALFGQDFGERIPGIVRAEETRVRFGLSMYSGSASSCPDLVWHRPRLGDVDELRSAFRVAAPGGSGTTPTAEAVERTIDRIRAETPEGTEVFLVLATDGEPNRCEEPGAQDQAARDQVVEAVGRAFDEDGVGTFVLSLAETVDGDHLQEVANAGRFGAAGDDGGGGAAPYWSPEEAEGLRDALGEIVDGAFSCRVDLEGSVPRPDFACREGTVFLGDRLLPCGREEDGFRVLPGGVLELLGRACEQFLVGDGGRLRGTFPCPPVR